MSTDLSSSLSIAASGMRAQGTRIRVVAENLANAQSTSIEAGGDPYRRKIVTFANELDRATNSERVYVNNVTEDMSDFRMEFDPNHPSANEDGYVKLPNVNSMIEVVDMREAQRSYEANLNMLELVKSMLSRTVELLRN